MDIKNELMTTKEIMSGTVVPTPLLSRALHNPTWIISVIADRNNNVIVVALYWNCALNDLVKKEEYFKMDSKQSPHDQKTAPSCRNRG